VTEQFTPNRAERDDIIDDCGALLEGDEEEKERFSLDPIRKARRERQAA
jgi:hypothetical protein